VRGQQFGKGRPLAHLESARQDQGRQPRRLYRSLEFLDHRGTGPEILRRHDGLRIQAEFGKQEPMHPLGIAFGVCHEQFRPRLHAGAAIDR